MTSFVKVNCNGHEFQLHCNTGMYGMDGVVLAIGTDITAEGFKEGLEAAYEIFPYIRAEQYLIEHAEPILYNECSDDGMSALLLRGVELDLADFDPDAIQTARMHEAGIRLKHNYEKAKPRKQHGWAYLLKAPDGFYKIGKSKDVSNRVKMFGIQLPFEVELLHTIESDDYDQLELDLHLRFAEKRVRGEWFNLSPDDIEYIKGL